MKELIRTTEDEGHYHIVYTDDDSGQVYCLPTDGHTHEAAIADNGEPTLLPAGDPEHLHELIPYEIQKKKKRVDKHQIVREVIQQYITARDMERDSREAAEEAEKYYCGEQWDDRIKNYREKRNLTCLTLNHIERYIDQLCGYQREQRSSFHYIPTEEGDQAVADVLNIVSYHIQEQTNYQREKSKVFEDIAITGRGNFDMFVSFDNDLRGEIKIERFPWARVTYGPHEKEDFSDGEYLFKDQMYSLANLKRRWPKKAKEINADFQTYLSEEPTNVREDSSEDPYDQGTTISRMPQSHKDTQLVDVTTKEFRELERWQIEYTKTPIVVSPQLDFYFNAYGWENKDLKKIRKVKGFRIIERTLPRIRITTIAGNTLLSDENPAIDLPLQKFFTIPVYGKKRREKFWGKVQSAKDAQKQSNYRHSQAIDVANKVAAYGWFYDDNTFPSRAEAKKFRRTSSIPGFTQRINDVNQPPGQVEGVKFPSEFTGLLEFSKAELAELISVEAVPTGANESGAHLMQQQRSKLIGNEYLFDNLAFAEKEIGRRLPALIRKYYSAERIWRIVAYRNGRQPTEEELQINGQPLSQVDPEAIIELLENDDLTSYDVEVTQSDYSPTHRLATFMLLQELAKAGYQIPPQILLEMTDVPQDLRTKIMSAIEQDAAAAGAEQDEEKRMEENKTLIAKDIIPPDVQQRLQQEAQAAQQQGQGQNLNVGEAPPQG